jgi:ribosome-associated protein
VKFIFIAASFRALGQSIHACSQFDYNRDIKKSYSTLNNHRRLDLNTLEIARNIVSLLEEKKGEDIVLLDLRDLSDFADYFVICTGTSDRMLAALADQTIDHMRSNHQVRGRKEGESREGWILVDYGDVILHLFSPDRRDYYRLEDLWGEAKVLLRLQ